MINNKLILSELFEGKKEEYSEKIEPALIDDFSKISGDMSRIHMDKDYAIERGFRDRVVHGAYIASKFSYLIGTRLPGDTGLLLKLNLNFRNPIVVGDFVKYSAVVKSIHHSIKTIEIELLATIDKNTSCCSGKSLVMISDEK